MRPLDMVSGHKHGGVCTLARMLFSVSGNVSTVHMIVCMCVRMRATRCRKN